MLNADYGVMGAALILVIYMLREHRAVQAFVGAGMTHSPVSCAFSFILINMYNGERGFIKGKVFKYVFYAAYPVHILLIWLIRKNTFGY